MEIFQIKFNYSYALADIVNDADSIDILNVTSENISILNSLKFGWLMDESSSIPDIAIIVSELLCCNSDGLAVIRRILPTANFTQIKIDRLQYFSLSNIPCLNDSINLKSSKIKYFSTGGIMEVESPMFNSGEYPPLFKVEEMPGVFFCTELFKDTVENNHLSGLLFTECKIKNKSWISNFSNSISKWKKI